MTDIVERLCDGTYCTVGCAKLRGDAAAEIERLRAALAEETECARQNDHVLARYEAALHGLMEATDLDEVGVIARRALEPKP